MNEIFFLVIVLLNIIVGIKLSYYADKMDKQTKFGSLIIGGIVLASITSIPEFITSISSILIGNPRLALISILGSNIFNIIIISFYDIIFIKQKIMNKISIKFLYILFILVYLYIIINTSFSNMKLLFFNIGIPTIVIFLGYILFLFFSSKITLDNNEEYSTKKESFIILKFIINIILMVILCVLLTISVDRIPSINSNMIKVFFLIISTSLPEMIIVLTLVKLRNYNIAFSNIVGSNILNLFILAISDFFVKGNSIYHFYNINTIMLIKMCIYTTILAFIYTVRNKMTNTFLYIIPSILIILICIYIWYIQVS